MRRILHGNQQCSRYLSKVTNPRTEGDVTEGSV